VDNRRYSSHDEITANTAEKLLHVVVDGYSAVLLAAKKLCAEPHATEMLRVALKASVKGLKHSTTIEALLGYTMPQLRAHLERQFRRGMTWDAWGRYGWHIDHILPKRCFDLTTIDGMRAYWALPNLRPLEAAQNLRKSAKIEVLV
jgi:hypothetical protein